MPRNISISRTRTLPQGTRYVHGVPRDEAVRSAKYMKEHGYPKAHTVKTIRVPVGGRSKMQLYGVRLE